MADFDSSDFRPSFPWIGGDLQTLRRALMPPRVRPDGRGRELRFEMDDGTGDALVGVLDEPAETVADKPLIVLVHGLTGCAESSYILESSATLVAAGHRVLRLNLRGAGVTIGACREQYHAGRGEDLRRVLAGLPSELTRHGMVLFGYSLGANMMLKFLGETSVEEGAGIRAAIAVSAPIDLAACAERFLQPRNRFYHNWIMRRLRAESLASGITGSLRAAVPHARTIFEFDDRITAPRNGFEGARDYYGTCSAQRYLGRIRVPTMIIHARDDPWIPSRSYLEHDWSSNPALTLVLSARGGHVGFHDGQPVAWHDRLGLDFIREGF